MKRITSFLVTAVCLLFASSLFAYSTTIDKKIKVEPDGKGSLKITAKAEEEEDVNEQVSSFAGHIGEGTATVLPGQNSNQFVLVFPGPVSVDQNQVAGVLVTATGALGGSLNINTQATITHATQPSLPEAAEGNHGLPLFSPLNALAQPGFLQQINQVLGGAAPDGDSIPVTDQLNIGGETFQVEGQVITLVAEAGNLQAHLAEGEGSNIEYPATVTVTTLTPQQVQAYQETLKISRMLWREWFIFKGRQLCDRNYWKSWKDYGNDWYQWGRGKFGKYGKYGKQAAVSYGEAESWGGALPGLVCMAGFILNQASARKP